jgi:hypothetical protein
MHARQMTPTDAYARQAGRHQCQRDPNVVAVADQVVGSRSLKAKPSTVATGPSVM